MINTMGMAAATAATVWLLAPTRSYGSVHKFPWQQVSLSHSRNKVFQSYQGNLQRQRPQNRNRTKMRSHDGMVHASIANSTRPPNI